MYQSYLNSNIESDLLYIDNYISKQKKKWFECSYLNNAIVNRSSWKICHVTRYNTQQITIVEQTKQERKRRCGLTYSYRMYVKLTLRSSRSLSPPCTVSSLLFLSSYICTVSSYISKTKQLSFTFRYEFNWTYIILINRYYPYNKSTLLWW
jgi:hypothetical protein